MEATYRFTVNGQRRELATDGERPLLEVLREDLQLTGTKCGCGEGHCGACTVLVEGRATLACTTPVAKVAGQDILTIEGLARDAALHPVQEAFLAENAFQCGFCTPGMILTVVGLLNQTPRPTEAELRARLEPHLCRCCGYVNLLQAARRAAGLAPEATR